MNYVWISAAGLCGSTILGALLGFGIKKVPHKWNDTILGFCAGMMLAAAILGLIVPAMEGANVINNNFGWLLVVAGVMIGALFLNVLDAVTPHLHTITGLDAEEHKSNASLNKVLLFVMAIAIHKLPEGIAAGVGFNSEDLTNALSVTIGISFQNIPEAMVIITPLLIAGVSKKRTLAISFAIALLEVVGVWIGYAMGAVSQTFLPIMLAFAGGCMLYIVSDEMIPETHSHGHQKMATYALLIGFLTLMMIEQGV
ncbi:MAG: ZIP family metal transporter [Bacteroidales bacterium]|mgnify:FL=1|nr:ZIP family metal transporter [Bacteroidales bacterium]